VGGNGVQDLHAHEIRTHCGRLDVARQPPDRIDGEGGARLHGELAHKAAGVKDLARSETVG
jgi:hypothetical protein